MFTTMITVESRRVNFVEEFKGKVLTGLNHCSRANIHATGVPSHLAIAHQVSLLKRKIGDVEQALVDKFEDIPKRVKAAILENFTVDGVAPLNAEDVRRIIDEALTRHQVPVVPSAGPSTIPTNSDRFQMFQWKGAYRVVPEDFSFPVCHTKIMWDYWHFGDEVRRIQPFKFFERFISTDFSKLSERTNYCKAKALMKKLEAIARENNLLNGRNPSTLSREEADEVFNKSYRSLLEQLYPNQANRPGDTQYTTLANRFYRR